MISKNFFLRNVVAGAICLAGVTMFSGCDKEDPIDDPNNPPVVGELTELKSPITTNTTLKDLGLPIDYFYAGTSLLQVKNGAILTIEDSVTIQFRNAGGGLEIIDGATLKALGTANKHIQFVGGATKGSWDGVYIKTDKENQLTYVDFINGGKRTDNNAVGVLVIEDNNVDVAKAGISHCTISGGLQYGLYLSDNSQLTAFDNNKIENVDAAPVYVYGQLARLAKFDMTSDFTNNTKPYIFVRVSTPLKETATLNEISVPYYIGTGSIDDLQADLTINAGVTIYMQENAQISTGTNANNTGKLFINGTPEKPVLITRLPGTSYYWNSVNFRLFVSHKIKNCIIEYSGHYSFGGWNGSIATQRGQNESGILELENVVIRNSEHYGIVLTNKQEIAHTNVSFANNAEGNVYLMYVGQFNSLNELP